MKNTLSLLLVTAAVALATSSYAADKSAQVESTMEQKNNGGYESSVKSEAVTAAGTKKTSESSVDVSIDSNGNLDKKVETENVADAKGLFNKKTDSSDTQIEDKANGGYKQTTTRRHADANGTNTVYKTVTDVSIDSDGNIVSNATTDKTVDPKGLMNKKTTTSRTKAVNGDVVLKTKKVD